MDRAVETSDLALVIAGVFGVVLILDVTLFVAAPPAAWAEQLLAVFIGLLALLGVIGGMMLSRRQTQQTA